MKKKTLNIIKNNLYSFISFIVALSIILIIYKLKSVTPFGKNSLLTIDFYHQYGPMLGELYDRIKNGSNLIYSFNMGTGLPFFRNFFNYLSSPINVIMFLFKHNELLTSYSIIISVKVSLSSLFTNNFLENKFNRKSPYFIALALLYAFNSYFIAFYWNIMWLDGLFILPIIAKGIDLIITNNKPLTYIMGLILILFSNYFIGYILCIFSVIYFISQLIIETNIKKIKQILKPALLFGISSLIAGGLCAWFLIPMYDSLTTISATNDIFPTTQYYSFEIKEFLVHHLSGSQLTVLSSDTSKAPNISAGILTIFLFITYWFNKNINLKNKIVYTGILLLLLSSFYFGPLDFIWHAMHVPNDLPFRYSFIYPFILIIISAESLLNINKIKIKYPIIVYGLLITAIMTLYICKTSYLNSDMLFLNAITITIYFLLLFLYKYYSNYKKVLPYILIVVCSLEIIAVINNNWDISQNKENFNIDYQNTTKAIQKLKENNKDPFRIENINTLTFNDPSWYNYYGQSTFSSMEYENLAILMHNLGLPGNEINSFYFKQTTPIYNLLFNIKYFIGENSDNINYHNINNEYLDNIQELNYSPQLLYSVNRNIKTWEFNFENPFNNLNNLTEKAANIDELFKQADVSKELLTDNNTNVLVKYILNQPNIYYIYNNSYFIDYIIVDRVLYYNNDNYNYLPDSFKDLYDYVIDYNEKYIINYQTFNKDSEIYVGYNQLYEEDFYIYTMDNNKYKKFYDSLTSDKIIINNFEEYKITANATITENKTIFTSIPYDKGWKVYIDNKETTTYPIANSLLGFDISEGTHKVLLKYSIPYFKSGLCISIFSLISLISVIIINKKTNNY